MSDDPGLSVHSRMRPTDQSPLFAKGYLAEGEGFEAPGAWRPLRFSSSSPARSWVTVDGRPVLRFRRPHMEFVRSRPTVTAP
jgi:hypothetical protein